MSAPVLRQFIGTEWREGTGEELLSLNPARPAEVVASGRLNPAEDVDTAVTAAHRAAAEWSRTSYHDRGRVLRAAAALLASRADSYGSELSREEGKLLVEGVGEVRRAAQVLEFYANEADRTAGEIYNSPRVGESIMVVRHPVGVVAAITPFNFPIAIPAWKIGGGLLYGNAVVWKPAPLVPLLAQRLAEVLYEAGLPVGVLQTLLGGGEVGRAVVEHPLVGAVSFTGSTGVGRALIAACGRLAKPIQAEMGGKNAAVVFADANLDAAVDDVLAGAFRGTGQRCTATSRLILEKAIADEFLDRLGVRARAMRVGDPLDPSIDMGPVVSASAKENIVAACADTSTGARFVAGSRSAEQRDDGYFVSPTVVELDDAEHDLWRNELFGPVLAVRRAESVDHAFHLANDSEFGLSCAIFTDNLTTTGRALTELHVGVLHVNSETGGADPHVPFGGIKASGFGPREQGRAARELFTQERTVYLRGGG